MYNCCRVLGQWKVQSHFIYFWKQTPYIHIAIGITNTSPSMSFPLDEASLFSHLHPPHKSFPPVNLLQILHKLQDCRPNHCLIFFWCKQEKNSTSPSWEGALCNFFFPFLFLRTMLLSTISSSKFHITKWYKQKREKILY